MKYDNLFKEILEKIEPSEKEMKLIDNSAKEISKKISGNLKKLKIKADIFIGGSFAKKTMIKKDKYDVDIFIRFDKKYKNNKIPQLTNKLLKNFKNYSCIHGSRDYFRINAEENLFIELIPVEKINNPDEAENITDLSYLHVKYINKKIKTKKILDEIKIAKAFCYANKCYGAESYIHGFSGYSLELLIYYYNGFLNFVRAMSKIGKTKEIIDIEKQYKNKKEVLIDLNSSKLNSPVILIDPTYKNRNALAALSNDTFERFQKICKDFLKNPSIKFFDLKKTDLIKIKRDSMEKKHEFILLEADTNKQEGDIAGSKLLKFYNHLEKEISRFFNIKNKGFNYNNKKSARYFFVAEKKDEIVYGGPFIEDKKNVARFKSEHKNIFEKDRKLYAREKIKLNIKEFITKWKIKNKKKIKEMAINDFKIVE